MKIVQVNKFYYRRGGAERYLFDLTDLLTEAGHTVIPFAMRHPLNEQTEYDSYFVSEIDYRAGGVRNALRAAGRAVYSLEAQKKFDQLLADTAPDVIHVHNIYHQISPSILYPAERRGIPVVQTLHDYQLICPNYTLYSEGKPAPTSRAQAFVQAVTSPVLLGSRATSLFAGAAFLTHRLLGIQARGVGRFICPSMFQLKRIVEWGHFTEEKFVHLPNPLAVSPTYPKKTRGEYVLYSGRFVVEKGLRELLQVARLCPNIPFVLVGGGPLEAWVRTESAGLPNVTIHPHTKDEKQVAAMRENARIAILLSLWPEVQPYALLEAQASGVPVVASKRGGIAEIVDDEITGILVSPQNPKRIAQRLTRLWNDTARLKQYGAAGWEAVRTEHDPLRHYDKLIHIYEKVINAV